MFQDNSQINLVIKLQNPMINQNKGAIISANPKVVGSDGDCVEAPQEPDALLVLSPKVIIFDGDCTEGPGNVISVNLKTDTFDGDCAPAPSP